MTQPNTVPTTVAQAAGWTPPQSYVWTRDVCQDPLQVTDVASLVAAVKTELTNAKLVIPHRDDFVRRCVLALLTGHLVLQGPPGTGKTTVARLLAKAFNAGLRMTTATAEWSTYDVVGGLRPTPGGALEPTLGEVTRGAIECAELIRDQSTSPQAQWLLVDELNRADIDKAVGPLYTVLSAVTGAHLLETPLSLWFETDERVNVWVPTRFRLIATMNDVDTSFVNAISQGLTRRFQFLFLGVPTEDADITSEIDAAFDQAHEWLVAQYGQSLSPDAPAALRAVLNTVTAKLTEVVKHLRVPGSSDGWPVGTAQVVDVWRTLLLAMPTAAAVSAQPVQEVVDQVLADRIVPQMGTLDDEQLEAFEQYFDADPDGLKASASAVHHLRNTRATR